MTNSYSIRAAFAMGAVILCTSACTPAETSSSAPEPIVAPEPPSNVLSNPTYYSDVVEGKCCTVIAHAAGAIDGNSYTNSIEAIERNYALGTRLFELDLEKTSDDHWVAVHDWPNWQGRTKFKGKTPPDLETYKSLKRIHPRVSWSIESEYTPMTFAWLVEFLKQHPDASIVTDIKELDQFSNLMDAVMATPVKNQFIYQAYRLHQIDSAKEKDPEARVILTLYRLGFKEGLFEGLKARKDLLFGVTVPMNWAFEQRRMTALKETGIPIFLHGAPTNVNSRALHSDFAEKGVSGFYLD